MNQNNNLVIIFDSWTKGTIHLDKIRLHFQQCGVDLLLIHIGSWGHDIRDNNEEVINGVLCRDITYYGKMSFLHILQLEKPSAVLFLSTRAFAHMAFNRVAMFLGIPTFHLYHGIVTVQAVGQGQVSYKINWSLRFRVAIKALFKNVLRLIPCYILSIYETKGKLVEYIGIFQEIYYKLVGNVHPNRYIQDTTTNFGIVYVQSDVEDMRYNYRIAEKNILVCGNPDLVRLGVQNESKVTEEMLSYNSEVLYIDTGLVPAGLIFKTYDEYLEHLLMLLKVTKGLNFIFRFKPHPAHEKGFLDLLQKAGILLTTDSSFEKDIKKSFLAIVETTSLAIIPPLLGLPILLAKFGKLRNHEYGDLLENCPISSNLDDVNFLSDFRNINSGVFNFRDLDSWVNKTFGNEIFGNPSEKVVSFICTNLRIEDRTEN